MKNKHLIQYRAIATFLAQQMQDCEFVIHDIDHLEQSIVFIANGHISGRKIGDSATDLVLRIIREKEYVDSDFTEVYRSVSKQGIVFNSSTYFIKEDDQLVGLLCINQDLTQYRAVYESVGKLLGRSKTDTNSAAKVDERLVPTVSQLPSDVIQEVLDKQVSNVAYLSKEERLDVVRQLDKKGVFLLKGAISEVAKTLKVSDATMYRYLQMLK